MVFRRDHSGKARGLTNNVAQWVTSGPILLPTSTALPFMPNGAFSRHWRTPDPLVPWFCSLSFLFSLLSFSFFPACFPLPQAKVDNEILNYKDLAALPKVKSIYEVQRPDLISYEPHSRYTSDEMLERCGYGEVLHLALSGTLERVKVLLGSPANFIIDSLATTVLASRPS